MPVRIALAFSLILAAATSTVLAQTGTGSATRTYLPADFARFAPRTALDMLNRVPGFTVRQEDQERGLGQASGNVLINSQRTSGKSNDVITELGRIPAQNVERIEIVDGSTLDIPGLSGQVANVIVRSTGISGQYAYRPEFRAYYTDPVLTRFEVSVSGTRGPVQYTLGFDNRANRSGAGGPTWIYRPDGSLLEDRDEKWRGNADQPRLSGKFVFDGPGTAIGNLNVSYGRLYFDYLETGTRTRGAVVDTRTVTVDEGGDNHEISGDYELALGPGRLKLIALNRATYVPYETNVITNAANTTSMLGSRFAGTSDESETIGRTEYRWTSRGAEWQVSGEAAFNKLESTAQLFEFGAAQAMEEIPIPGATASVSEDRYEVMGGYSRPLSETVSLKFFAGGEYSQLSGEYPKLVGVGGTRRFYRPKGELSAAWKASDRTDVNVKVARRVGQLQFSDFLASVDLGDDFERSANPDLVPQQSWTLDVEGVRNLGRYGTTTLILFGRLLEDIIDYVPIGETGQAPGNLDHATAYGIESRSTFNLDAFGWAGARLDARVMLQETEVDDPLTGEARRISNSMMEFASLSLRHDIAGSSLAWGGGASYQLNALSYKLTEVGRQWEGPVWADLFLEHKDFYGLALRGSVGNLLSADSMWDRTVYVGRRTGAIDYVEERDRTIGPIFSFSIRGKF